jgi:two-component system, cell cycle sensor histidine kinase and response regulator CckA
VILVVDDESGIREFLKTLLLTRDFQVISAGSGEEALELWNEHGTKIDLVITDIVMPGIDGKTLADRLRASQPKLPIIFISGYLPERIAEATLDGPFFKKPFGPFELLGKVEEMLGRKDAGA